MPLPNLAEGISLGLNYDNRNETVRLPAAPLPGHTFVLAHSGAGAPRVLAQAALLQAAAGRPTAILDPHGDIRHELPADTKIRQLNIRQINDCSEITDIITQGGAILLYDEFPHQTRPDLTDVAQTATSSLQAARKRTSMPAVLIADCYQPFADLDWNLWTDRTQNGGIHTIVSTNRPPTAGLIKRPIPVIANADAIIIRTTSRQNLAPILDDAEIDDDLSPLTDLRRVGIGYLWLRDTKWSAFFTDRQQ